ncbi:hypothetical protein [Paenibacillus koleovorans]|uniref:hypothetical protein n=1 Tax=Paenibacillus koleovorans TaxID=121608 RepID=UPI000FD929A7|nr:hypothetical protein [Paenibacillus koleovorans]
MVWILVAVVIAAVVVLLIAANSRNWRILETGNGRVAEEVYAKHAYLKDNQVKCKLKTEQSQAMGAIQGGGGAMHAVDSPAVVRLYVHKKDVDRASTLLEAYNKEIEFSL